MTGHSLGGSLAQIVGALYDVETVTFNAYGVKDVIKTNQAIYPDKITVLNSFYGKSVGEMSQSEIDELLDDVI